MGGGGGFKDFEQIRGRGREEGGGGPKNRENLGRLKRTASNHDIFLPATVDSGVVFTKDLIFVVNVNGAVVVVVGGLCLIFSLILLINKLFLVDLVEIDCWRMQSF